MVISNTFFLIISIFLFLFAPKEYNYSFVLSITLLFLMQTFLFTSILSRGNYVNFYSLFFLSYFFINFFYPVFLYPVDPEYFSIFSKKFDHNVICKATALAQIVSSSLILGASFVYKKNKSNTVSSSNKYLSHLPVTSLSLILFLVFILTVGSGFLKGDFTGQSAISLYVLPLVICSFTLSTIIFFRDYFHQNNKNIFYLSVFLYISLFLFVGDRGPALSILLVIFGLYSIYIKKIKIYKIVPIGLMGIFLMRIIGEGRVSGSVIDDGNVFSRGFQAIEFNVDGYYNMTLDFVINCWTLYIGFEYVDNNGIDWGVTFLKPLLGVVPFLQGLVASTGLIELTSASEIFTQIGLGNDPTWGLGTNLISSVYIAYGLCGCVGLFLILGVIVEYSRVQIYRNNKIIAHIIYFTLLGYAVYYPRTDFLMPLKFIIWTIFIYILLVNFKLLKSKVKRF